MENRDKFELTREYVQRLRKIKYRAIRAMGFGRFSIVKNRIVEKTWISVICGVFIIITDILIIIQIIYETTVKTQYLLNTELTIVLELTIIINLFLLEITFGNRFNVSKLIKHSIEMDVLLGIKDTKFMRDIADEAYNYMSMPIFVVQVTVLIFLYITFNVSFSVHVTGSAYFFWAFFALYDLNYLVTHLSFLNLRTRYMNVAVMKAMNVKVEYIPDLFLFNGLFWKPKHNDLVNFHTKANMHDFVKVYKMLYTHLELFQQSYRFAIFTGIMGITVGSLLSVQITIIYGKTGMDIMRKYIMVSWVVLSWLFITLLSLLADLFSRQIEQTKLICTYAQLKRITNETVYIFTKSIFSALDARVARASIYSICFFDPGVMLRIAASTFVYVTAQLQISMPTIEVNNHTGNITSSK